jgi:hypothetical protein
MRRLLVVSGTVLVCLVALLALSIATAGISAPLRYELPDGYRGWVLIQYKDSSCSPLVRDGISEVLVVPESGRACTSAAPREGWHIAEYKVRSATGPRSLDESQITIHSTSPLCSREQFYVRNIGQESIPPEPPDWGCFRASP